MAIIVLNIEFYQLSQYGRTKIINSTVRLLLFVSAMLDTSWLVILCCYPRGNKH